MTVRAITLGLDEICALASEFFSQAFNARKSFVVRPGRRSPSLTNNSASSALVKGFACTYRKVIVLPATSNFLVFLFYNSYVVDVICKV